MNWQRASAVFVAVLFVGSMLAPAAAAADITQQSERADLAIEQPDYIDSSISVDNSGNRTIYQVRGPEHEIQLQNTNHSNVTAFGIQDGAGNVSYDAGRDVYVFNAQGQNTTTQLYWTVDNGDGDIRKTATIQVSDPNWVHRTNQEDQELQQAVSKLRDIEQQINRVAPGEPATEVIDDALGYYQFFSDPVGKLRADMFGTLIMFSRPGGLIILGLLIGIPTILLVLAWRTVNRLQKQLQDFKDIRAEKDEAWLNIAKKIFQQNDWVDLFPDDVAYKMREFFGRNTWLGAKQYMHLRSSSHVKAVTLQAMGQAGYTGIVERDREGEVIGARAIHETDIERDEEDDIEAVPGIDGHDPTDGTADDVDSATLTELSPDDEEDQAIIDAIPGADVDEAVWDRDDLDPAEIAFPIDNRKHSDAEIIDKVDPAFPGDFRDEEHMARTLGEMLKFVENHEYYTDDEGNIRGEMDLLSFLSEMDTVLSDEADFPVVHHQRKQLFWIADNMDKSKKLEERIDGIETDGLTLSSEMDRSTPVGD